MIATFTAVDGSSVQHADVPTAVTSFAPETTIPGLLNPLAAGTYPVYDRAAQKVVRFENPSPAAVPGQSRQLPTYTHRVMPPRLLGTLVVDPSASNSPPDSGTEG